MPRLPTRRWLGLAAALVLLASSLGATALPLEAASAGPPRGIHLSLTEDARTTITIAWFTDGAADPAPVVAYGIAPNEHVVAAASSSVPGVVARMHSATLRDLAPGTTYAYRVGGDSGWSETFSFRTDDGDGTFRVVAFGDHGVKATSNATVHAALALAPDLVIIPGDLSYANGDQPDWDVWFDLVQPLAARVPLMPAIGNHEGLEEGAWRTAPFEARFVLPGAKIYYGFDYGRVHFTLHDSDIPELAGSGRLHGAHAFLAADLADAAARRDEGRLDHVVVVQHHPLYGNHEDVRRQWPVERILTQEHHLHAHGVKLLLSAHNHHYERSKPMAYGLPTTNATNDYEDPEGFIMVITGGGGQSLYHFQDPTDFHAWSAAHARRYHLTLLEFDGGRVDGRAIDTWFVPDETFDRWSLTMTAAASGGVGAALRPALAPT